MKPCPCGSGKPRRELRDARNISCGFVCDDCEAEKRGRYRAEVFEDPHYDASDLGDDGGDFNFGDNEMH